MTAKIHRYLAVIYGRNDTPLCDVQFTAPADLSRKKLEDQAEKEAIENGCISQDTAIFHISIRRVEVNIWTPSKKNG